MLFLFCTALGFFSQHALAYSTADTVLINQLNAESLELAYSNPKKGLDLVQKTIALSRKTGFTKGEIMALIRRGIIFDVTSEPEKAIQAYQEALALSRKTNYKKGEGSALNNIGLIQMYQHKLTEARVHFQQAHDIFLEIRNEQLLSSISNNLGMIYYETNRKQYALYWFWKSLRYSENTDNQIEQANTYANLGDLYHSSQQYDSAAFYSRKAIAIYEQHDNTFSLGKSYNNLALILGELKQNKEAERYYLRSLDIARKIENIPMLVSTAYNLGQQYNAEGKDQKEIALLEEIYPLISGKEMPELAYKVCNALASWHYHHGSPEKGDRFMKEYVKYHAIYFDQVNAQNLNEIEQKYDVEKKEHENMLLKKSNELKSLEIKRSEQQATILNLAWASGLFFVLLITLALILWFRKKNFSRELENQKAVFDATFSERKRISFDLHDNVGSQLSYVVNNLELLNQQNKDADTPDAQRIERTFKMSQEAIDSLRDTVWALHNASITVEVLSAKLESFAFKVTEQDENIQLFYEHEITKNKVISPEHTMHIFRIFQESVNNVLKHAGATIIQVSFRETPEDKLILEVSDNGKGIENDQSPEGHFGLKNMSERATQIGALWKIERKISGGTSVYLEV